MRYLPVLLATLLLAACNKAPVPRSESPAASSPQVLATGSQEALVDSVVQYLLTSAATDFHAQSPSHALRFRNVRLGHVVTSSGEKQYYRLCGQFQPVQEDSKAEWVPFATIRTSGYEQWLGGGAVGFCQDPSLVWDNAGDLSDSLQSRFNSLR